MVVVAAKKTCGSSEPEVLFFSSKVPTRVANFFFGLKGQIIINLKKYGISLFHAGQINIIEFLVKI